MPTSYAARKRIETAENIPKIACVDGNGAAAHIAQALSDVALVYPVSGEGSTVGGNLLSKGAKVNAFGQVCQALRVDTSIGAGTVALGSLAAGSLTSVCCSSPSLRSMLPRLHHLAATRTPCVVHVAANGLSPELAVTHDLGDIIGAANSGFGMLQSFSTQEAHDIALIAHVAAGRTSLPFLHYFDGVRVATEMSKVDVLQFSELANLVGDLQKSSIRWERVPKKAIPGIVDDVMNRLRGVLHRKYELFEYFGSPAASTVVVALCGKDELQALKLGAETLGKRGQAVGIVAVRMLRPWSIKHFLEALNVSGLKRVAVFASGSTNGGTLYADVAATVRRQNVACNVHTVQLKDGFLNFSACIALFSQLNSSDPPAVIEVDGLVGHLPLSSVSGFTKTVFWDKQSSATSRVGMQVAVAIGKQSSANVHALQLSDSYQLGGAAFCTQVLVGQPGSFCRGSRSASLSLETLADFVVCHDTGLIDRYGIANQLKDKGTLLLNTPLKTQIDLEGGFPAQLRREMAARGLKVVLIDAAEVATALPFPALEELVLKAAFLALTLVESGHDPAVVTRALAEQHSIKNEHVQAAVALVERSLVHFEVPLEWIADVSAPVPGAGTAAAAAAPVAGTTSRSPQKETGTDSWGMKRVPMTGDACSDSDSESSRGGASSHQQLPPSLAGRVHNPSYVRYATKRESHPVAVSKWHQSAWHIMFPEAYNLQRVQRPQEHIKTFVVNVLKNERVTPSDYERNVFHIEFDCKDTDLSYNIGEALGVYGHNRTPDVDAFLQMYGLDGADTVSVRLRSGSLEVRSVRHVCTQVLDLFGRPNKRFYGALATTCTDPVEKAKLEWLGTPAGAVEFKKRAEDTTTFAALLKEFESARPTLVELVEMVPPIKARHYSIASSMKMHPGQVHLLVVLVDWTTADGSVRYGQCSKYLADLLPGDAVTVDIMPSVMKLPEDDERPIVMAGLGTGMAPFRAFIEERACRHAEGKKVGPMCLFFGSRSQREEYLYGEELEAYVASGLLTVSCAFSRDQPHKIYIQHRMQEHAERLYHDLVEQGGSFYLCGPTWPAGDVQDAIEGAMQKLAGMAPEQAAAKVREMKDEEKYILEVY